MRKEAIMLDKYCRHLVAILFLAVAFMAQAQQRRTVTYQMESGGKTVTLEAYTYDSVDECPSFPGGECAMTGFINKERHYPAKAYNDKVEDRVLCGFIILPNGTIINVEVLRGVDESLNEEAVRVIGKMPRWQPGKVDGEAVAVYYTLTIPFRL